MKVFVLLGTLLVCGSACWAEKNADLATAISEPGEVLFRDDFGSDDFGSGQRSKTWSQIRGQWNVENGVVLGRELKAEKHAAVFHCLKKNRDSIVRFSFQLRGAKEFHFSLNHKRGHLFRVVVNPTTLVVRTDGDKRDKSIKSEKIGSARAKFEQGVWYTMQIEMVGERVAVTTDNGAKVIGKHARLDTDKPHYRFILKDEFLALDDVTVWSIKVPVDTGPTKR